MWRDSMRIYSEAEVIFLNVFFEYMFNSELLDISSSTRTIFGKQASR